MTLLHEALARLSRELSPDAAAALANHLESCRKPDDLKSEVAGGRSLSGLRTAWQNVPDTTAGELATAVRVACVAVQAERALQSHSLVLTGPALSGKPVPRIEQALQKLIDDARQELLLVSFVAYKARSIVAALERALDRGVRVTLVLETQLGDEKVDLGEAQHLAPGIMQQATVLEWPVERRPVNAYGQHGSLHAKVAVADGAAALVSSANLTGHAMDVNIEAGVMTGPSVAESLRAYFRALESRDDLVAVDI